MPNNIDELIARGSATAKAGFSNEADVVNKFNDWKTDEDAQQWLAVMQYRPEDIEYVEAINIKGSYKSDIQVKIKLYRTDAITTENISIKLVSNPQGFNQIDKRWVDAYAELWAMPPSVVDSLKLFTGENTPQIANPKDPRRMFLHELGSQKQQELVSFFHQNKSMIISDILKGRDKLAASWMLIYQKNSNSWSLLPMSAVIDFYANGDIELTPQGSLKIGQITMQRKGGDNGRKSAQMLQFKMNPCKIINDS